MNKKKNGIAGVLKGENTMLLFAVALFAVCLILVSLGTEGLTAIYESGKAFGQWLAGLF